MKTVIAAFALLSCGICGAAEEVAKQVRVSLQWVEVPHPVLTEMLSGKEAGGPVLHEKAAALCKEGKAKTLETCMVVCPSGGKATLESIREDIHPVEYEIPDFPDFRTGGFLADPPPRGNPFEMAISYDTRNTGVTLNVESRVASDGAIHLGMTSEVVNFLRLETWSELFDHWGDRSLRMSIYEAWQLKSTIRVEPGKFELVSVVTPKSNASVPGVLRKLMVFVRADVIGTEP